MHQKTTLDNGLRLVTAPMPHTRSVSLGLFIGTGSRYENDAQAGISHFIEHMCFRGTSRRPISRDIATAIEGVGGSLNAGTDKELTIFWCKVAQPHFPLALDVLTDMLLDSKFEPDDIEKERHVIMEEINMCRDSPSQRVGMLIDELLWPGHPLGRDIAGTRESLTGISRAMLLDYLQTQYQPTNTVIAIAGAIEHKETIASANRSLGQWRSARPSLKYLPCYEQTGSRISIESRPDLEQAQLCLALPGLSLFHPKRFVLDLLNVILGEGMSSRLFTEIRDKKGLAYSISSYVDHFSDTGALTVAAGVEPKQLEVAISAILEELSRLKEPMSTEELTKAKEFSKGHLLLRLEDSRSVAGWMGGQELLARRILSVDEVVAIIDAITAADLQQLAQELLTGDKLRLAVVGPVAEHAPLEKLLKL